MFDQRVDGFGVEQVRVVVEIAGERVGGVLERQREIELGRAAVDLQRRDLDARELEAGERRGLEIEHHLEEGRAAHVAVGLQRLDQHLERHVLVRKGAQHDLAHPGQRFPEGGRLPAHAVAEVRSEDQGVEQEADQMSGLAPIAVGDGRAHGDIGLPRVTEEQDLEAGKQRHEERRALAAGQGLQPEVCLGSDGEPPVRAGEGLHRGPRPVGGKFKRFWRGGQPVAPVRQLLPERVAGQPCRAAMPRNRHIAPAAERGSPVRVRTR